MAVKGVIFVVVPYNSTYKPLGFKKILPFIALAVLLALSLLIWQFYEQTTLEREERRYNEYINYIVDEITDRLHQYEMVLLGGAGVYAASEEVTREEWRDYYEYREVSVRYPGIQGVGFSRVIKPQDLAEHIEEIRAEGFNEYTVWPEGEREVYVPVVYIEPFDERNRRAFGYDLYSEPVRREAMERSRDTGAAVITGMTTLVTESEDDVQPGLLMFVPVYQQEMLLNTVDERRAAIKGYISCVFRMNDLMQNLLNDPVNELYFQIHDGETVSSESLLYESSINYGEVERESEPLFTSPKTLDLYGHQWTFTFETRSAFEAAVDHYTPKGILAAGFLLSFFVFFYLRTLQTTGEKALSLARDMTNTLRESEEKYRFLTENIQDVIWAVDMEGHFTYISPAIEKLTGFTPEEVIAMPINEFVLQEDFNAILEKMQEELAKPAEEQSLSVTISARHKTRDDSYVHVEFSASWKLDEQGNLAGMQGSTRDITERKQLEEIIIESRRKYQSVVDTQKEMICRYLPDTTLTFVNDAFCRAHGKSRQELLGSKFLEFTPPESRDELIKLLNSLSPDKPSVTKEHRAMLPDGSIRWHKWTDQALFSENGKVIEYQGVGRDITKRVQAEKEMHRQGFRTRSLLKIASRLNAVLELNTVLRVTCEEICSALNVSISVFQLYDEHSETFAIADSLGLPTGFAETMEPLPCELYDQFTEKHGKSNVVPDISLAPDLPFMKLLQKYDIRSLAYAALEREGRPMGIILAASTEDEKALAPDASELLAGMADLAASAIDDAALFKKLEQTNVELLRAYDATIEGWAYALDLRDEETEEHSQRVTELTLLIAQKMGIKDKELVHVKRGALLHDIGKISVPDSILLKPGPLTEEEWKVMRKHPSHAYEMLSRIEYLRLALDIPYCHHEKWDGTGYPRGLKDKEIPLPARIFAVVDVYDALTSDRPYRKAWSEEDALDLIKKDSGSHFDPEVVEVFFKEIAGSS